MAMLSDFVYHGSFDVFNDLDPEQQEKAMWGVLNIARYMTSVFAHVNDDSLEQTLFKMSAGIHAGIDELDTDEK